MTKIQLLTILQKKVELLEAFCRGRISYDEQEAEKYLAMFKASAENKTRQREKELLDRKKRTTITIHSLDYDKNVSATPYLQVEIKRVGLQPSNSLIDVSEKALSALNDKLTHGLSLQTIKRGKQSDVVILSYPSETAKLEENYLGKLTASEAVDIILEIKPQQLLHDLPTTEGFQL